MRSMRTCPSSWPALAANTWLASAKRFLISSVEIASMSSGAFTEPQDKDRFTGWTSDDEPEHWLRARAQGRGAKGAARAGAAHS